MLYPDAALDTILFTNGWCPVFLFGFRASFLLSFSSDFLFIDFLFIVGLNCCLPNRCSELHADAALNVVSAQ